MLDEVKVKKIKEIIGEFLHKMTIAPLDLELSLPSTQPSTDADQKSEKKLEVVEARIQLQEPQFLIGQNGQTLFELERILRIVLNKSLGESFYLNMDINDYKAKKVEYLKTLAKESAQSVVVTKEKKALPPMSAYERRIIHKELDQRQDIATRSEGEGEQRHIVISPADSL